MNYIICSCARSGSTLLAEALLAMGAGKPEEYLGLRIHNGRISTLSDRKDFMQPTPLKYIERVKQENTINGIFGLKAHYSQLARFPEINKNFMNIFPDAKFISITRRNTLRQAISATRAVQTWAWTAQLSELKKPRFNPFGIVKHLILAAQEIELWERFYAAHGIKPFRILYEDLDEDYMGTMQRVVSFLGISGDIPLPPIKKQADDTTDVWSSRCVNLLKEDRWFNRVLRFLVSRF